MINPGLFFLLVIIIIPGFFAQLVSGSIITKPDDKSKTWDLTYNSIIHSLFIYIIIYIFWYPRAHSLGINIFDEKDIIAYITKTPWMPLIFVSVILLVSSVYGICYAVAYRFELIKKITSKIVKPIVVPPNILADLMDEKYGGNLKGHWLTFKLRNTLYNGSVKIARLDKEPNEFLLQDIVIMDTNTRDILYRYPPDQLIWLKIDDRITMLEIKSVSENAEEKQ
jgi:hypothetical protein